MIELSYRIAISITIGVGLAAVPVFVVLWKARHGRDRLLRWVERAVSRAEAWVDSGFFFIMDVLLGTPEPEQEQTPERAPEHPRDSTPGQNSA